MYRLSFFLPIHPNTLQEHFRAFRFVPNKEGGIVQYDHDVTIQPLRNQRDGQTWFGYRLETSLSYDALLYCLDMLFDAYPDKQFTGIEFHQAEPIETSEQEKMTMVVKGVYKLGHVQVIALPTHTIFQKRGHFNQSQLYRCLREIEDVKESLNPSQLDLFSYAANQY